MLNITSRSIIFTEPISELTLTFDQPDFNIALFPRIVKHILMYSIALDMSIQLMM